MTEEEWVAAGRQLSSAHHKNCFALGDWYVDGCREWGVAACRKIVEAPSWQGVKYTSLRVYATVARKFPKELRRLNCAFSLYQQARSLEVEVALQLLGEAEREGWTENKMRIEARRRRCSKPFEGGDVVDDLATLIAQKRMYCALYADPPMPWNAVAGKRGASEPHYPSMSLDALCALPVAQVATHDAFLFLWTSAAALEDRALPIMTAWNFAYKTHAVWDKITHFGTGFYFRMCHELLLVGVRPNTPLHFIDDTIPSIIRAKRREPHSAKPLEVYDIIERAVSGPYLELFARERREGWDAYGNQLAQTNAPLAAD